MTFCSPDGLMTSCRGSNFNLELLVKTGKTKFSATDSTGQYQFEMTHFKLNSLRFFEKRSV